MSDLIFVLFFLLQVEFDLFAEDVFPLGFPGAVPGSSGAKSFIRNNPGSSERSLIDLWRYFDAVIQDRRGAFSESSGSSFGSSDHLSGYNILDVVCEKVGMYARMGIAWV